jgi:hypothetical protein
MGDRAALDAERQQLLTADDVVLAPGDLPYRALYAMHIPSSPSPSARRAKFCMHVMRNLTPLGPRTLLAGLCRQFAAIDGQYHPADRRKGPPEQSWNRGATEL